MCSAETPCIFKAGDRACTVPANFSLPPGAMLAGDPAALVCGRAARDATKCGEKDRVSRLAAPMCAAPR